MLDGRNAVLKKWSPDFSSSSQSDPTWTRIVVDDFVVCNSIEYTDWATNPVQIHQDEFCGFGPTGYNVDITRLGTNVLWTPTPPSESDGKEGRVFCSTQGASEDILSEGFRRCIVNGTLWCMSMEDEIKEDMDVSFVGPYNPSTFNFKPSITDAKPSDIEGWNTPILKPKE